MTISYEQLVERAIELGAEPAYEDVHGTIHRADPRALAAVVDVLDADDRRGHGLVEPVVIGTDRALTVDHRVIDAELVLADATVVVPSVAGDRRTVQLPPLPFGCHSLRLATTAGDAVTTVVAAPRAMPHHRELERRSGLFVPTYALWDDDAPLPSFRLLARLAGRLDELGIAVLTTLPLFAAFLDDPFDPSPYSPASRLHWNECFLDDARLPDVPEAPPPEPGRYLDWAALSRRRRRQLLAAATLLDAPTQAALDRFEASRPDVGRFAAFMAHHAGAGGGSATTRATRASPEASRELVERSHVLAQFLAHQQLSEVAACRGAALAIDLPIGCHRDGYEPWAHPELFATGMSIGAPPDLFFADGQDWALPPQLPAAGRRSGHQLWRDLLHRAGEHAALVRIDHVMAVHRLWWIPEGMPADRGVYVRYPRDELLAVIAAAAVTSDVTVVGEDLGTVPVEVRSALARWQMLGMYEEQFHTHESPLPGVPARSVAGVRTHDMQPFAAFVAAQGPALDPYRRQLTTELGRAVGLLPADLLDAVVERLNRSAASLVVIDLDDLLGETEEHNTPGRVSSTIWRRRLDRPLGETLADHDLRRRLELVARRSLP